jgi:hypothetical protein
MLLVFNNCDRSALTNNEPGTKAIEWAARSPWMTGPAGK